MALIELDKNQIGRPDLAFLLINRRPTASEYQRAVRAALDAGLWRLDGMVPGTARARFIIL